MESSKPTELIKLSFPAALLSSLSKESSLTITNNGKEQSSLSVSRAANKASEVYALQTERSNFDCYQVKRTSCSNKVTVHKIGATRIQHTMNIGNKLKLDTSTSNLKRIGAQTRKLLDEERKKRKEIVRLDDGDLLFLPDAMIKNTASLENTNHNEEREQKTAKLKKPRAIKRKRHDPTIDSYMPCTEHLLSKVIDKEDKSNVIRLHGLPLGVRAGDIRKFFDGLNPVVFALPSYNDFIEGWDAEESTQKNAVERYPETFRVYAKFQSVLIADAAMERSGESIGFNVELNSCPKQIMGANISMSPVPRYVASFLLKHMAIYIRKRDVVSESLTAAENRIEAAIDFVWIMAASKLKLELQYRSSHRHKLFQLSSFVPQDTSQYNSLVKVYNQLIDEHQKLEMDISLLLMCTFDPTCINDPAHKIAQSVSNWLLDEICIIENHLNEARQRNIRLDL